MGNEMLYNGNQDEIWYLAKNPDCKYSWADADDDSQSQFVINMGGSEHGVRYVIAKYSHTPPTKGGLFYADDQDASLRIRNITYQLKTCRSNKRELIFKNLKF